MKTIISYNLLFSREHGHPFLSISTVIFNKAGKVIHRHQATVSGDFDWELRELWEQWKAFKAETADDEIVNYMSHGFAKSISITKVWEG